MASIRRRGGKYQVQVRRRGSPSVCKTFHVLKDAQAWARQMEVQADRGDLPSNLHVLQQVTLGDLITRYRDTITIRKRGHRDERIVLNTLLHQPICRKRLSEITAVHFAQYRDQRLLQVKPATVKRQLGIIRNLYEVARKEWGFPMKVNPITMLNLKAGDQRRERRLRPGELDRLMHAARACRNPLISRIIQLAVETGMRRGELLAVRRTDIDLSNRTLLISNSKNGHSRTIPLTKHAVELLHQCPGQDRVFPITANAFRLTWERVKRRAGIDDLHFHDLRHEAISRFFEMGLNSPEVALISGHRDMRMLARYTHPQRRLITRKLDAATDLGSASHDKASTPNNGPVRDAMVTVIPL
jgi:integrase